MHKPQLVANANLPINQLVESVAMLCALHAQLQMNAQVVQIQMLRQFQELANAR
jgi:hypothetical protein